MVSRDFVLAGLAIFTVRSVTGKHYTFKVEKKEANAFYPESYFAKLLTGPDNTRNYSYMGTLDTYSGAVRVTKASKYDAKSEPVRVFSWFLGLVFNGKQLPDGYSAYHEGRCGRCGRSLTTPESCEIGIGPECLKQLGM
jgi:hypothetical protein